MTNNQPRKTDWRSLLYFRERSYYMPYPFQQLRKSSILLVLYIKEENEDVVFTVLEKVGKDHSSAVYIAII